MKPLGHIVFVILISFTQTALSQSKNLSDPLCLSASEAHKAMQEKLGIIKLRPGKNGNPSAANNPANYDPQLANPYPNLPDVLITKSGNKVTSAEQWWNTKRPEIKEGFATEVYGKIPENVPEVSWKTLFTEQEYIGWTPVIAKKLVGHVDNSTYPQIDVNISMTVVTPANANGPVPILMMFGPSALPAPRQPNREDFAVLNESVRKLLQKDSEIKKILNKYPAYNPLVRPEGVNDFGFYRQPEGDLPKTHQLINAGWGYALIDPSSIQPDNGDALTCEGIIALTNKGQARNPDDWGALRAWAWGATQGLNYLETDSDVDAKKVGIEGVSRYGKAALVTMAFDERFAIGLIGSSGKGGTTLHRRNFGEAVENLAGGGEFHWMAGNYLKYATEESGFGSMDANNLPVDSHELIALCAPRAVFISYGIPEQGDANWLDHQGSYMAAVAAQPVYKLLGKETMGVSNNYKVEKMPNVNEGLLNGVLAWRQHDGGHTDTPNISHFINWANDILKVKKE